MLSGVIAMLFSNALATSPTAAATANSLNREGLEE
jgi:hypothetical protein